MKRLPYIMTEQMTIAKVVVQKLEQAGFEAVIVGGAVRDALLNRPFHDVDVATEALPEQVKALFPKTIDVGIEHGTVLVLEQGVGIEVTTYRTESTYSDSRRPDAVQFVRDLREDVKRRDFTMNALAMRADGEVVDYYGGQTHLAEQLICAVGEPSERFREDALRMLRAVRFVAQLGFTIEAATMNAIQQHAPTLQNIAIERIQAELEKLFVAPFVARGIEALRVSGLAEQLPGVFNEHAWQHMTITDANVGWAYLAKLSQFDAVTIAHHYRLANKQKQFIAHVLAAVEKDDWTPLDYFTYDEHVLVTAGAIRHAFNNEAVTPTQIRMAKSALPIQEKAQLAVNGQHVMSWYDKKSGPWLKEALAAILAAVVNGDIENDEQRIKEWFNREWNN